MFTEAAVVGVVAEAVVADFAAAGLPVGVAAAIEAPEADIAGQEAGLVPPEVYWLELNLTDVVGFRSGAGGRGAVLTPSWDRDPPFGGKEITI